MVQISAMLGSKSQLELLEPCPSRLSGRRVEFKQRDYHGGDSQTKVVGRECECWIERVRGRRHKKGHLWLCPQLVLKS